MKLLFPFMLLLTTVACAESPELRSTQNQLRGIIVLTPVQTKVVHVAVREMFLTRSDISCFSAGIVQSEDAIVVFFHKAPVIDGDQITTFAGPTRCGYGEEFTFSLDGELLERQMVR